MIKVTLNGDAVKEYQEGTTVLDVAKDISEGLARVACAGEVDGEVVDLRMPLNADCSLKILTFDDDGGKRTLRHTASHCMAQAIKRLWPEAKLAIGPAIDNGFYYDIDYPLTMAEIPALEAEMKKVIKESLTPERFELSREDALKWASEQNEPYKVELINDLPEDEVISFYKQGEFTDLCAGPHLMNTKVIKAFKLTSVAGAYWRGSEKNKMLTRIYGTAFTKAADLEAYLAAVEEAKKRDHRKLGKELELFMLLDEGPGFPFFLPKGMELRNTLMEYWREEHKKAGYVEVSSPMILKRTLWETSGHWNHYKENMYITEIDEETFAIKPMNCPGGMLVYKSKPHSYKDLPIRMAEVGTVHRHELSGALHGLMRVRCFNQDDAHVFMTPDQMKDEIQAVIKLIDNFYSTFGFKYHIELSTMPDDHLGDVETWDSAIAILEQSVTELGYDITVNPGDGAFYGPKLDFHLEDSIGRTWQCGTIQLDYQLPERFELEYTGSDGEKHRPIMIHRVVLGSFERFLGILIEHFAGSFPVWLSPVQAIVLPISERFNGYAESVEKQLLEAGIKAEVDTRNEKIGFKIREARNQRIPYILVVGEKEAESGEVSLRSRKGEEGSMAVQIVIDRVLKQIKERSLDEVE